MYLDAGRQQNRFNIKFSRNYNLLKRVLHCGAVPYVTDVSDRMHVCDSV